jgi:transcriptional regulator with PAS, ATPase and Fis domain
VSEETATQSYDEEGEAAEARSPGLVLAFSGAEPILAATALGPKEPLFLGRGQVMGAPIEDTHMSRQHAEVRFSDGRFVVRDRDSHNGTFLDGARIDGEHTAEDGVLRVGDTLLLLSQDVRPLLRRSVELADGVVIGPTLRETWNAIAEAAVAGGSVHIAGETGSGKELAAKHFHTATGRGAGPFVAVNCATVPPHLAERLLFGVKRGAYTGADRDADGYVQAADGGTLFLDELAELSPPVQAKLLRVLETGEVLPLGATRARAVDLRLCTATHRDLRTEVAEGRFREDLYYRISHSMVSLPPLRDRRHDIPWLVRAVAATHRLRLHVSFVEAILMRSWPGNVRELLAAATRGARAALAEHADLLRASHLEESAGRSLASAGGERGRASVPEPSRVAIERALAQSSGNISAAAAALGLHRTQLRRWIARLGVTVRRGDQ